MKASAALRPWTTAAKLSWSEMLDHAIRAQPPQPLRSDRLEPCTFPLLEMNGLAEGVGDDEDDGEQDRRVELEAPERLQCDLAASSGV
jgi:hypothetical protein